VQISATKINGVYVLKPKVFKDQRGFFSEFFNSQTYFENGINFAVKQVNYSYSDFKVLRGLHFQRQKPQAKIIQVLSGEIYDVCADINPKSATFGQSVGIKLSAKNRQFLLIPKGLAHGFCVLSKSCAVQYLCDEFYDASLSAGIIWNDPTLKIDWPYLDPKLSLQDQNLPSLTDFLNLQK